MPHTNKQKYIYIVLIAILFAAFTVYISFRYIKPHNGIDIDYNEAYTVLKELDIVKKQMPPNEKVTRFDFIKAVIRTIGANDNTLKYIDVFVEDLSMTNHVNWEKESEFFDHEDYNGTYQYLATFSDNKIVYGEKSISIEFTFQHNILPNSKYFRKPVQIVRYENQFNRDKYISVKNAAVIIERCLQDFDIFCSTTQSYSNARRLGIINNTDSFATISGYNTLKYKDMYILLYRLLNQKRYKYFPRLKFDLVSPNYSTSVYLNSDELAEYTEISTYINSERHLFDYDRSITYWEYLLE